MDQRNRSPALGVLGYVGPLVVMTAGYAVFQTANQASTFAHGRPEERGVLSGLLNLSRHLGLITGASALGMIFATAAGVRDIASAAPAAVTSGTRLTFGVGERVWVGAPYYRWVDSPAGTYSHLAEERGRERHLVDAWLRPIVYLRGTPRPPWRN